MRSAAALALGLFAIPSLLTLPLLSGACFAEAPPPAVLPLASVRLYETGVGYFTRAGRLDGTSPMTLPVPVGHLDDALKSLVVMSADKESRIQGVEFGSSLSRGMARALAGLPQKDDEPLDWHGMLVSLKGASVEVRSAGVTTRGRVVDVTEPEPVGEPVVRTAATSGSGKSDKEAQDAANGCLTMQLGGGGVTCLRASPDISVLLLTDKGELRRFGGRAIESVHPTEAAFAVRLNAALDALSTRSAQTGHPIRLLGHASGPVTLGYIAEAPLFRTSWRLVVDDKGAVLVGWALLHNDTDEDWKAVKVELVNGQPDSFLYPMAAPRYARRTLVHPENPLSTVPQLLGRTADGLWGDFLDEDGLSGSASGESYGMGGIGTIGHGSGGGGSGYGVGHGSVGSITTRDSSELGTGNLAGVAEAAGVEGGALFTYTLPDALDLRGHGSALVPFLQKGVEAEEVTLVGGDRPQPRSGVRFVNGTGQTLPSGPIAFFSRGGFSGESGLDRLKPGERRFLEFGNDLDLTVDQTNGEVREEIKKLKVVTFRGAALEEHYLKTSEVLFTIENRSGRAKRALVQLACGKNSTVNGADGFEYDPVHDKPLAALKTDPRSKAERKIAIVERLVRRTLLDAVTSEQLRRLIADAGIPAAERAALEKTVPAVERREAAVTKKDQLEAESNAVNAEVIRLRDDLKALGANASASNALVSRVASAEDKLSSLRKRIEEAQAELKARTKDAEAALKSAG